MDGMSVWVGVIAFIVVLGVGGLLMARGGKESRAVRRELRQLRRASGRRVNEAVISERRRAMSSDPIPGSSTNQGGI